VFAVMALAPQHSFQVLTKRPERARAYLDRPDARRGAGTSASLLSATGRYSHPDIDLTKWPLPNVWLGTSVEDQATADARIPHLLATPAAVRFISAEPLLGTVDLTNALYFGPGGITMRGYLKNPAEPDDFHYHAPKLDWVIVGGESGPGARPMHPDWARSLRDQCRAAGVAFHFKQWGEWIPTTFDNYPIEEQESDEIEGRLAVILGLPMYRIGKGAAGRILDGRTWDEVPG
jgi:protein gp37